MELVKSVEKATAVAVRTPLGRQVFVAAIGIVPTSGWSGERLSPHYYVHPPADGIWEFSFVADPPAGPVLDVEVPVAAVTVRPCPDWVKGVKIIAADNNKTVLLKREGKLREAENAGGRFAARTSNVIYSDVIAVYDDSFQPIGLCGGFPPHIKMKKLRHELTLTVEGPDEAKIRRCVEQAIAAGLIAACIAAFVTGGAALPAAIAAATSALQGCLGRGFTVRFDDRSHWIEWCT
jgi:hypothetical protein